MADSITPFHTTASIHLGAELIPIPITVHLPHQLSRVTFHVEQDLVLKPDVKLEDLDMKHERQLSLVRCGDMYTLVVGFESPQDLLAKLQRGNPSPLELVATIGMRSDCLYDTLISSNAIDGRDWFPLNSEQVTNVIHQMWRHQYLLDVSPVSQTCITLTRLVECGHVLELKRILPSATNDEKMDALICSCELGQVGCVAMILGHMAPEALDWTRILQATIKSHNVALFDILLAQSRNVQWQSILHAAIRAGDVEITIRCFDASNSKSQTVSLDTCVIEAARRGHTAIISYFYDFKDKIISVQGWEDVLKIASKSGFLEIVALIVELSFSSEVWKEALVFAVLGGHSHLIEFILNAVKFTLDVGPALAVACENGLTGICDLLTNYVHKTYNAEKPEE